VAIVEVHAERIEGPWTEGFVLDRHVVASHPIGYLGEHMQFETTRSALGELVYQLKYRDGKPNDIVETAVAFITRRWNGLVDCVVPPPPSLHRIKQPAVLVAEGIATSLGVPSLASAAIKATATQQMKNVPLHERAPLLSAAIQPGTGVVQGRRVLLVDDLWETGATLRRVAEVLGQMGASEIRALVMTRTK
jgi:competence protein ComFC